ncbi:MAG: LamG domain-containing protein, partial [Armatimonadota bacterium]
MSLKPAMVMLLALVACSMAMAADGSAWWDPRWRFRTTVVRPTPYRDALPRPVEVAVDFPLLLRRAGVGGTFDAASLRVIDPDGGDAGKPVPFAYRTEFDARAKCEQSYLVWTAEPTVGVVGRYDIYFGMEGDDLGEGAYAPGQLPPVNLVTNGSFEEGADRSPAGWAVEPGELVSVGTFAHTTGKRSLRIEVDEDTPDDVGRDVTISQTIDVGEFAGQEMVFECDLLAERAAYGAPVSIELEQLRADGSRIREYAIQPRWLTVELAEGHFAQFCERGRFSHEAATVNVRVRMRLYVRDADTNETISGPESLFTVWLDRMVVRPGERWPWPALSHAGFVEGALEGAPLNRAFEFTGQRRLAFNGASEGTLTAYTFGDAKSVHWGLAAGTLEFWCRPSWSADDGAEHILFESKAYGHRRQSRLRKLNADGRNELEFMICDCDREARTVRGAAPLQADTWHHIAATWDFAKAHLQLFVDGRRVAQEGPGGKPWPASLVAVDENRERAMGIADEDRRSMPMQAFIGGEWGWTEGGSADAAIDEFRISDVARYAGDFGPAPEEFEVDEHTRALFHFEDERDGVHDSDDGFVRGHLGCELEPQQEAVVLEVYAEGKVKRRMAKVKPHGSTDAFEENRAENRMTVYRPVRELPDPRYVEYRERYVERVLDGADDEFTVEVGGDFEPWMRSVTFRRADGASAETTLLPRWRANDNVVPFSVESIAATLAPDATDDAEKALAVMRYALDTTNYYDAHFCESLPTRHRPRVSYTLTKALNIYPHDQCGPMNYMLRKLFLAAGVSSNDASGTHHQFQQAFYDGSLRLFDLSSRLYWLERDNATRVSRRGLEEDPYLKLRQGGNPDAWLRGRRSRARYGGAQRPHSMDFALRPGERAAICWHNEGRWFELTGDRKPIPLAKIPPLFGNGAIVFEPTTGGDAVELDNMGMAGRAGRPSVLLARDPAKAAGMIYRAQSPYIISDCRVTGAYAAKEAGAVRLSLSVDQGKTWKQVWSSPDLAGEAQVNLRDDVSARYAYWLRLDLAADQGATVTGLRVRTAIVASPYSLPGTLSPGENRITFVAAEPTVPVRTACSWVERHKSALGVSLNSIGFYLNGDQTHRNLFVVAPDDEASITVGLHGGASRSPVSLEGVPDGWEVQGDDRAGRRRAAELSLRPREAAEGEIHGFDVVVRAGRGERRIPAQVLVARAPLVREAEQADEMSGAVKAAGVPELSNAGEAVFAGDGQLAYDFQSREGKHALWVRARWEPGSSTAMKLVLGGRSRPHGEARDLRAAAMIGFTDWTDPKRAHTKMFAHYGEQYGHWSWYRIPDVQLASGEHRLLLSAGKGAHFDALVLLPQTDVMDRAA